MSKGFLPAPAPRFLPGYAAPGPYFGASMGAKEVTIADGAV